MSVSLQTTGCSAARAAYDGWHSRLPPDRDGDAPWHRLLAAHLDAERDLNGKTVLEIGCGGGGFACTLARQRQRPLSFVAADFSSAAIAKGRACAARDGLSGISWEVADIQALAHPADTFDTVISCETIEHVASPQRALRELARVLKRGGRLIVTTPNYFGSFGMYRLYLRALGRPFTEEGQPINRLMLLPLTIAWVKQAGLKVRVVDAVGHYLLCPGRAPIELPRLNNFRPFTRWVAFHSLVVAEKP
jgi:2-polyprenyl-3-methyl-5-hydroxy-6-metoxy-1,4-benzoquinol methylase